MTTTPAAITKILDWQRDNAGRVFYSQAGPRLACATAADLLTPTDCSGMVRRMFEYFAGIVPGTFTGDECFYGELVTTSKTDAVAGKGMLPGDVVLFDWPGERSTWDHIAIYAGDGRIWNHGGVPEYGPVNWNLAGSVYAANKVMVRRYLPPTPEDDMPAPKDWDDADWAAFTEHVSDPLFYRTRLMVRNALGAFKSGEARGWFNADNFPAAVKRVVAKAKPSPHPKHGVK